MLRFFFWNIGVFIVFVVVEVLDFLCWVFLSTVFLYVKKKNVFFNDELFKFWILFIEILEVFLNIYFFNIGVFFYIFMFLIFFILEFFVVLKICLIFFGTYFEFFVLKMFLFIFFDFAKCLSFFFTSIRKTFLSETSRTSYFEQSFTLKHNFCCLRNWLNKNHYIVVTLHLFY